MSIELKEISLQQQFEEVIASEDILRIQDFLNDQNILMSFLNLKHIRRLLSEELLILPILIKWLKKSQIFLKKFGQQV